MTILETIAQEARLRVEKKRAVLPLEKVRAAALSLPKGDFAFECALAKPGLSFICECKKASPSKGVIADDFPYLTIAMDYERAGADAISVLTEPKHFLGDDAYLREISEAVSIPTLRKDFVVDEYMLYEAKCLGASAVLLIVTILTDDELTRFIHVAHELGLSALVEVHDDVELTRALKAGARIVGVNNRNLKDFTVDTDNARRLREKVPHGVLFVSESGVKTRADVELLEAIQADAVLIGETLMRASDKVATLAHLRGDA